MQQIDVECTCGIRRQFITLPIIVFSYHFTLHFGTITYLIGRPNRGWCTIVSKTTDRL